MNDLCAARQRTKFLVEELQCARGALATKRHQLEKFPHFQHVIQQQIKDLENKTAAIVKDLQEANSIFHDLLRKETQTPGQLPGAMD